MTILPEPHDTQPAPASTAAWPTLRARIHDAIDAYAEARIVLDVRDERLVDEAIAVLMRAAYGAAPFTVADDATEEAES